MNTITGATARFGVAVTVALGVSLTAHAQAQTEGYADCPAPSVKSPAARDARTPCPPAQPGEAYLQWAVARHRVALGSIYLTAQNPVAPHETRTRGERWCGCATALAP